MSTTIVSPKYQVVIPKEVRTQVPIKTGQRVQIMVKGGVIYLIPSMPIKKMRGRLGEIPLRGFREKKDRL